MEPKQIALVQETWQHVLPIADLAADLFYDRLFELDPTIKTLFENTDLAAQKGKLIQTLATTIAGLHAPVAVLRDLEELGRCHASYGVVESHYDVVGAALLWTLEKGLAEHWSDDAQDAWATAYGMIAGQMQKGANTLRSCQGRRSA